MVQELMQEMQQAASLDAFLESALDKILDATGADGGWVLSLSGRSLSITAAQSRFDGEIQAGKILCLNLIDQALRVQQSLFFDQLWKHPEVAAQLQGSGVDCLSVGIFPFLSPDGKKGALYLGNPKLSGSEGMLQIQPFMNLIPMSYLHFQSQTASS